MNNPLFRQFRHQFEHTELLLTAVGATDCYRLLLENKNKNENERNHCSYGNIWNYEIWGVFLKNTILFLLIFLFIYPCNHFSLHLFSL